MENVASQIIYFMKIVEKLCLVKRDNLLSNGMKESDSDHIMKLAFLVLFTIPYLKRKVDATKMLEMVIVHDLVEASCGDIPLAHQQSIEAKKLKKQRESEAIEHYKTLLPEPIASKIYDLFNEYEDRQTDEAKIVYCLDKIEANLQANQHNDGDIRYWEQAGGGDWYYRYALRKNNFIEELDEEIVTSLQAMIVDLTKNNMEKCNIPIPEGCDDRS